MNESDTRLHKIDPKLKAAGWGVTEGSRITTEYTFTRGKISRTQKGTPKRAVIAECDALKQALLRKVFE